MTQHMLEGGDDICFRLLSYSSYTLDCDTNSAGVLLGGDAAHAGGRRWAAGLRRRRRRAATSRRPRPLRCPHIFLCPLVQELGIEMRDRGFHRAFQTKAASRAANPAAVGAADCTALHLPPPADALAVNTICVHTFPDAPATFLCMQPPARMPQGPAVTQVTRIMASMAAAGRPATTGGRGSGRRAPSSTPRCSIRRPMWTSPWNTQVHGACRTDMYTHWPFRSCYS